MDRAQVGLDAELADVEQVLVGTAGVRIDLCAVALDQPDLFARPFC